MPPDPKDHLKIPNWFNLTIDDDGIVDDLSDPTPVNVVECECGSAKIGWTKHSDWCKMASNKDGQSWDD